VWWCGGTGGVLCVAATFFPGSAANPAKPVNHDMDDSSTVAASCWIRLKILDAKLRRVYY
jgi:hypothetical protein